MRRRDPCRSEGASLIRYQRAQISYPVYPLQHVRASCGGTYKRENALQWEIVFFYLAKAVKGTSSKKVKLGQDRSQKGYGPIEYRCGSVLANLRLVE